jgi:hypothetical protein
MKTAAAVEYRERYLRSPRWRIIRWMRKRIDGRRCRMCFSPRRLEVHHKSYKHKGDPGPLGMLAELRDCVTLCHDCHMREHGRR